MVAPILLVHLMRFCDCSSHTAYKLLEVDSHEILILPSVLDQFPQSQIDKLQLLIWHITLALKDQNYVFIAYLCKWHFVLQIQHRNNPHNTGIMLLNKYMQSTWALHYSANKTTCITQKIKTAKSPQKSVSQVCGSNASSLQMKVSTLPTEAERHNNSKKF